MKTSELKLKLKSRIDGIDDKKLLKIIEKMIPEQFHISTEEEYKYFEAFLNKHKAKYFDPEEQVEKMLVKGFLTNLEENC